MTNSAAIVTIERSTKKSKVMDARLMRHGEIADLGGFGAQSKYLERDLASGGALFKLSGRNGASRGMGSRCSTGGGLFEWRAVGEIASLACLGSAEDARNAGIWGQQGVYVMRPRVAAPCPLLAPITFVA